MYQNAKYHIVALPVQVLFMQSLNLKGAWHMVCTTKPYQPQNWTCHRVSCSPSASAKHKPPVQCCWFVPWFYGPANNSRRWWKTMEEAVESCWIYTTRMCYVCLSSGTPLWTHGTSTGSFERQNGQIQWRKLRVINPSLIDTSKVTRWFFWMGSGPWHLIQDHTRPLNGVQWRIAEIQLCSFESFLGSANTLSWLGERNSIVSQNVILNCLTKLHWSLGKAQISPVMWSCMFTHLNMFGVQNL